MGHPPVILERGKETLCGPPVPETLHNKMQRDSMIGGRMFCKSFCCVGALILLCVNAFASEPNKAPSFSIRIAAPDRAKAGAKVILDVRVTNISKEDMDFGTNTHEAQDFEYDVYKVRGTSAKETQYLKALKGEDQGVGPALVIVGSYGWAHLKPKQTLHLSVELTALFELQPGKYTLRLRRPDEGSGSEVMSNQLTLKIEP
jgi:hypothetical protein